LNCRLLKKDPVFFTLWFMPMFQSYTAVQLFEPIVEILEEHVQGLTEHKLLYALSDRGFLEFNPQLLSEELSLFQTHFFLFHVLYRLRDLLHEQGKAFQFLVDSNAQGLKHPGGRMNFLGGGPAFRN